MNDKEKIDAIRKLIMDFDASRPTMTNFQDSLQYFFRRVDCIVNGGHGC